MTQQRMIRASLIRGGTSKGLFLNSNALPSDRDKLEKIVLRIFGSPDRRQIDGIGGADMLTSKCCIIGPSSRPDADIDYTFIQVAIDSPRCSFESNCGNLSPAAAVYAIREGFVKATEPVTEVRIHQCNLDKILLAKVPVKDGEPLVDGDFVVDGVPGSGAEIVMDYSQTAGGTTGVLFPFNEPKTTIHLDSLNKNIEITLIDIGNLTVFFKAEDLGFVGTELPGESLEKYILVNELREAVIKRIGRTFAGVLPMMAMIGSSQDYKSFVGTEVCKGDIDFTARLMHGPIAGWSEECFMHKALPGSCSVATTVAALVPGTIVNKISNAPDTCDEVRIGHPSGRICLHGKIEMKPEVVLKEVIFSRTVRPIMDGYVMIPESFYDQI